MVRRMLVVVALLAVAGAAGAGEISYFDSTGALRRAAVSNGRLLVDPVAATRFTCSLTGLAAALTQCQAAPAAGQRLYVTDIVVQTTTATSGLYALQTGTGVNCATATTALFPSSSTAARLNAPINTQATASINLTTPFVAPADHALCVIGTATNTISIQISGYVAP